MNIKDYEARISSSLTASVEALYQVGKSLAEIKDQKLYKAAGDSTFDAYMKASWDMGRNQGYNLIYAAEVIEELREHFDEAQLPQTESALRPLHALPKEKRVEVWREALSRCRTRNRPPGRGLVVEVIADLCS